MIAASRLVPLLLLGTVVAGCTSTPPVPDPTETPLEPALPVPGFSMPLSIDPGHPSAEPSIRVGPDGAIWITAPDGLASGDHVWRSRDNGATFQYLGKPDPVFGGGDSDFAIDPAGRLFQTGLWLGCVSVATSADGEDWTMNPLSCGYPVDDRNWIEAAGNDVAYVTFGAAPAGQRSIVLGRVEIQQGIPVLTRFTALPDSADYQWPGNLAVDAKTGTVYVAYLTEDDNAYVYRSTDQGRSATRFLVSERKGDTFDSFAAVAVDRAGNLYYTWSERDDKARATHSYVAFSTDQGQTWSTPRNINQVPVTTTFPWLAAGDAGHVALVYYGTTAAGKSPEKVDGEWHVYLAQSVDALAANASWVETTVSREPAIRGSICTSGTGCAQGTRSLLDYFQVALDPTGHAHVAWAMKADGANEAVVMHARQTTGLPFVADSAHQH